MRVSEVQSPVVIEDGSEAQALCGVQEPVLGSRGRAYDIREAWTFGRSRYVYVLKGGAYYKIGVADDPGARISHIVEQYKRLEPKAPFVPEQAFLFECWAEDAQKVERELHRRFAAKRMDGEWFALMEEDIQFMYSNPLPVPWIAIHASCRCWECASECSHELESTYSAT